MISVIIPTLNEEKFLPRLLTSLTKQSDKDFEVIIADGSSKDKTIAMARTFEDQLSAMRILEHLPKNVSLQRNHGAREAKGEWLAFIDADSVLFPNFIERITQYIHEHNPGIITTWTSPDSDSHGDANIALLANILVETSVITRRPFSPGPMTVISRDVFRRIGGYDETCKYQEDFDLSMRAHKLKIPLSVIPETLYIWSMRRLRKHGTLRVLQQYVLSALGGLVFSQPLRFMPGYSMGGHLYGKTKKAFSLTTLRSYEKKLKSIMKEFLE